MPSGPHRLFAGRRITLVGVALTIGTIVVAFGIGIAAGWATSLFANRLGTPTTSPTPSETPLPAPTPTTDVSLPPMEPVDRDIDAEDNEAGLRTLEFPVRGEGTFSTVAAPTTDTATPADGVTQYVRIDVEDGLEMLNGTLSTFVMSALNDPRGWGKEGPTTFVQTDGAPDVRIVFATPYTAAVLCPTPHEPAPLAPDSSPSPSPSPTETPSGLQVQCAAQGTIVVSVYDWIQGLESFGQDRTSTRIYLLNHALGHVLGKPDVECVKGLADVMVDQRTLAAACTANPWPFPDAS